jgi:glucose-1-phosphate thymidylyltransferase
MPQDVIGLIPAAGRATRLPDLPCSKEVTPIGHTPDESGQSGHPKAVCQYLLEKMRFADIKQAYIILREGKWDIPAYFRDGSVVDMHLAYLLTELPFGAPYTLDQAYPFVKDSLVALGFPDILFSPDDAYTRLLEHQQQTSADVVLGLFPADRPEKVDMVDVDPRGNVREIVIKPKGSDLRYTWGIATWTPRFTQFMHEYLAREKASAADRREWYVGHVFQAALQESMSLRALTVSDEAYLDIGTPEDLAKARARIDRRDS